MSLLTIQSNNANCLLRGTLFWIFQSNMVALCSGGIQYMICRWECFSGRYIKKTKKLLELLDKIVREGRKEWPNINYKKTECLAVSKRNSPRWKLWNRDLRFKQIQKFKYLAIIITENGKYNATLKTEGTMLSKVQRNKKMECCSIHLPMKFDQKVSGLWLWLTMVVELKYIEWSRLIGITWYRLTLKSVTHAHCYNIIANLSCL